MSTGPGGVKRFCSEMVRQFKDSLDADPVLVHMHPADWGSERSTRFMTGIRTMSSIAIAERSPTFSCYPVGPKGLGTEPLVGFVHDLRGPMVGFEGSGRSGLLRRVPKLQRLSIRSWDTVTVPSPHVADDVAFLWPNARVECIGEGIDHLGQSGLLSAASAKHELNDIVVIGGAMPHKRTDLGLASAARLAELVGAEKIWVLGATPGQLAPYGERCQPVVSDEAWRHALARSRMAIAPSEYEGFGLAVGEAVHAGVPVIYGEGSGLGWVVGGAGVAAGLGIDSLVDMGQEVWRNCSAFRSASIAQSERFSWQQTANRALALLGCEVTGLGPISSA